MKTVIIDNYDSFTYNLVHLVRELGAEVTVWRNDRFALQQLEAIGEVFGAKLTNLAEVYHGVATPVTQFGNDPLFTGLPKQIEVGRYHSWVVDRGGFPDSLEVTAVSDDGHIMGLKHRFYDIHGIQFHPESVLTPLGREIVNNWLKL